MIDKHGLTIIGLKQVSGETKTLDGRFCLQVNYNTETGELWTDTHVGNDSWTSYKDEKIITAFRAWDAHTMQEIADKVYKSVVERENNDFANN